MAFSLVLAVFIFSVCPFTFTAAQNPIATILNADLPFKVAFSSIAYPGGDYIYLFGGQDFDRVNGTTQIIRFTITTEEVEVVGELPWGKFYAATTLEGDDFIYLLGGWCACGDANNEVILKFDTRNNSVEEVPTTHLPQIRGTDHSIVSYQRDSNSEAYFAISLERVNGAGLHIFKMGAGGSLTELATPSVTFNYAVNAMEVLENENVAVIMGRTDERKSRIVTVNLTDGSLTIGKEFEAPNYSQAVVYGSLGRWYLLPVFDPAVSSYYVRTGDLVIHPVDNYPEMIPTDDSHVFTGAAYVYVEQLGRVYVFGGLSGLWNGGDFEYFSTIWTIQFPTSSD